MVDLKSLYVESSEWLEQKAKVVELEKQTAELMDWAERAKRKCELAKVELSSIEKSIREAYNTTVLSAISLEPLDDYYYERKLNQDGFIRGHKL